MLITSETKEIDAKGDGDKKEYQFNYYVCDWCGLEFEQVVRTIVASKSLTSDKVKLGSSQVQCARCKNFIPTRAKNGS